MQRRMRISTLSSGSVDPRSFRGAGPGSPSSRCSVCSKVGGGGSPDSHCRCVLRLRALSGVSQPATNSREGQGAALGNRMLVHAVQNVHPFNTRDRPDRTELVTVAGKSSLLKESCGHSQDACITRTSSRIIKQNKRRGPREKLMTQREEYP